MSAKVQRVSTGYVARRQFRAFHRRKQRWAIVVAHRRAGKTVACINDLIDACLRCNKSDPRFAYIAPYFSQAKDVAWNYLKHFSAPIPGVTANESELRVDFPGGGRIRLYGADNYERLRGIYLDGVVLDEVGDMDPRAWSEVIRASLADRIGWAVFIGTPKGANHFKNMWDEAQTEKEREDWFSLRLRASETLIIDEAELADNRKTYSPEKYAAEFECSFEASVVGAFYGKEIADANDAGRICGVPYDPSVLVDTWWDLGIDDSTAIWFTQNVGREIHVIDCLEASGEGLPWYAKQLSDKPYLYGTHNAPHDIQVRELGSGKSRMETAASLGITFHVVPNIGRQDGIDSARSFIARCWFDQSRCKEGLNALSSYQKVWDDKRKVFQSQPLHNWASNYADAFRYLAVGHKLAKPQREESRHRMMSGGSSQGWMGV